MIILGADPGFASFGWAVVKVTLTEESVWDMGVIRTEKSAKKLNVLSTSDNIRRGREIAGRLGDLYHNYWVDCVCAEAMSFPRSSSVAGKMCLSWGILIDKSRVWKVPIMEASPQAVKMAVCGNKSASKDAVQAALVKRYGAMVDRGLGDLPTGQHEHAFDALAAVVACLDSDVIRMGRRAG